MKNKHSGKCHCGILKVTFETEKSADKLFYRQCQCSYCTPVNALYCTDSDGFVEINSSADVGEYSFALRTAKFLFCKACGCYLCAIQKNDQGIKAVVNARFFPTLLAGANNIRSMNFDGETVEQRTDRRNKHWTPAKVVSEDKRA